MQVEQGIVDAGAQIIWVLEQDESGNIGTAANCRTYLDEKGSTEGLCVGDGETMPDFGAFDNSPFSVSRGFDMIVVRETMEIVFTASHGTNGGNENIDGERLLEVVQQVVASLP